MGVAAIASRTSESLGVEKTNLRPIANEKVQIIAEEYNRACTAIIELQGAVGTTTSPAGGSIEARLVALEADDAGDDTAIAAAQATADNHEARHIRGGADEIDGDLLDVDYEPTSYTPSIPGAPTATDPATHVDHAAAHFRGIDTKLGTLTTAANDNATAAAAAQTTANTATTAAAAAQTTANTATTSAAAAQSTANTAVTAAAAAQSTADDHDARHIRGAADELDGDLLDIDYEPTNYTPSIPGAATGTDPATHVDHAAAHFRGINAQFGTNATAITAAQSRADDHDVRHIRGGADELDGDLVDVDFVPTNYTRTTDGVATHVEHLRSHLGGVDLQFATVAASLALLAPLLLPLRAAYTAASNTLALSDASKGIPLDRATAISATVPPNSSVAFPVGTLMNVFQYGAGAASIVAGAGVTIRSLNNSVTISGRYAMVTLIKLATDEWLLVGTLA